MADLNFLLLCDPQHEVIGAYGSWGPKIFAGKEYYGTLRNTFVIGPDGHVKKIFRGVTPKGHAKQVTEAIKYLPCPRCKKHDNELLKEIVLHQWTKEEFRERFDQNSKRKKTYKIRVPWGRFRITRKCRKCGYVWTFEKDYAM